MNFQGHFRVKPRFTSHVACLYTSEKNCHRLKDEVADLYSALICMYHFSATLMTLTFQSHLRVKVRDVSFVAPHMHHVLHPYYIKS